MSFHISIEPAARSDIPVLSDLIRNAFKDVARTFDLTLENCPRHPSNCTDDWIEADMDRGVIYYILSCDKTPAGCVGLEKKDIRTAYLERLAVLPRYRHQGFGKKLVAHILTTARQGGAKTLGIGIIAEQEILRTWYETLGFVFTGTREFAHLPFTVGFMNIDL